MVSIFFPSCVSIISLNLYLSLNSIAHEGKVIVAGFASRQIPNVPTSLLLPQSFSLIGVSLSHYRDANNEVYRYTFSSLSIGSFYV